MARAERENFFNGTKDENRKSIDRGIIALRGAKAASRTDATDPRCPHKERSGEKIGEGYHPHQSSKEIRVWSLMTVEAHLVLHQATVAGAT